MRRFLCILTAILALSLALPSGQAWSRSSVYVPESGSLFWLDILDGKLLVCNINTIICYGILFITHIFRFGKSDVRWIFYVLGVNASLADLFEFNATADYANLLAGYASEDVENGIPHTHEITLNLSSLLGSDMFAPTTARISTDRENLIVGLNVDELLIDFGAGTLRAELEAKNNVNNAFDATCFEEYRNHLYGSF